MKELPLSERCILFNASKELPVLAKIPIELIDDIRKLEAQLEKEREIIKSMMERSEHS